MNAFTFRDTFLQTISSSLFQQIVPFVVLSLVPVLVFLITSKLTFATPHYPFVMGLESLGFSMPWNWFSNTDNGGAVPANGRPAHHHHEKRKSKKSKGKTELVSVKTEEAVDDGYYPGLVNISGTYCFMNSTVQALSSLSYLQPQIDAIHSKAEALDVPTPVIDTLQDLFHRLNTQTSAPSSIRPLDLISVLSSPSSARFNSLFNSREHQDAQELFQLVSECIKNETINVDKEGLRDRGLNALSQEADINPEIGKSVFDGLTANRRSCVICGYTEAVMHFAFDNWQLAVPRMAMSCTLEDCLEDYTRLEVLRDCICRRCSMLSTHRRLMQEVETLVEATKPENKPSASKKRRLKDVRKMEARVKAALDEGRIEDELKDIRMEKVFSSMSTKQAMIARPPPVLALHINRSVHYSHYATKNNIRVIFPEVLDLTPFTTSGNLSTVPTSSLSTPSALPPRSGTPTRTTYANLHSRTVYRLSAVVCHYGQHSFGHYISFRRKPPDSKAQDRWKPPRILIKDRPPTSAKREEESDPLADLEWEDADSSPGAGKGWLRISDDSVDECGIKSVLREGSGAFMLYYERAILSAPMPSEHYPYTTANGITNGYAYGVGMASPESSEETLKPEMMMMTNKNGSVRSLVSINGTVKSEDNEKTSSVSGSPPSYLGPRVVRSVAAGRRRRSNSVTPGLKRTMSSSPPPTSSSKPISISNGHGLMEGSDTDPMTISSFSSSAPASLFSPKPPASLSAPSMTSHRLEPHNHKPDSLNDLSQPPAGL
ncbi:cysteine proteinase [Guyanagaster necrorhizus]|uniref:ubiquitinyl hydrolase 1 n=1 Tax=Guyanagaster necrorhizus TaxID=856835 RepID=A0A9P7VVN6_9AGAR|nr:cysteine proteinase [Guyanagaster necrorhizus MCA 3950]KAG7447707.1 cysteine proteinase [Guyanagaster necrorhizus MCA 3950]